MSIISSDGTDSTFGYNQDIYSRRSIYESHDQYDESKSKLYGLESKRKILGPLQNEDFSRRHITKSPLPDAEYIPFLRNRPHDIEQTEEVQVQVREEEEGELEVTMFDIDIGLEAIQVQLPGETRIYDSIKTFLFNLASYIGLLILISSQRILAVFNILFRHLLCHLTQDFVLPTVEDPVVQDLLHPSFSTQPGLSADTYDDDDDTPEATSSPSSSESDFEDEVIHQYSNVINSLPDFDAPGSQGDLPLIPFDLRKDGRCLAHSNLPNWRIHRLRSWSLPLAHAQTKKSSSTNDRMLHLPERKKEPPKAVGTKKSYRRGLIRLNRDFMPSEDLDDSCLWKISDDGEFIMAASASQLGPSSVSDYSIFKF